ncbi:MAG: 2-hydroxyacyl-CoA dehydratase family protein [Desulfobacteraceae bacterium]
MTEKSRDKSGRLNASKKAGNFMKDYYLELDRAARTGEKKVAWCTSVGPAELLRAIGFSVYFPETHAAMIGAVRTASEVIGEANAAGYSPDICSYLTSDIGAYLAGASPLKKAYGIEGPPAPDVLVFNTNQCRDVQDWFLWYAEKFSVPILGIHTPVGIGTVTDDHVRTVAEQMKKMISPLEEISGTRLDPGELKRVTDLSKECSDLWKQVLETARFRPSPLSFFDAATLMGPAVVGRGTREACLVYRELVEELDQRVRTGTGAVPDERFRIYWDGMPVWGRLSDHSRLFSSLCACVVASTYCSSWIFTELDGRNPFESMARAYTELFIVRSDPYKEQYIKRMFDFFSIDGIVFHDAKTCPNNSNSRYGMPGRLRRKTGIPAIVINADLNDMRMISDEQTRTNIEAFIEQMEENGS